MSDNFSNVGDLPTQRTITVIKQPPTPIVPTLSPTVPASPSTAVTTSTPIRSGSTSASSTITTTSPTTKGRAISKTKDGLSVTTLGSMDRPDKVNDQMDWTPVIIGAVAGIVLVIVVIVVVCCVALKKRR